MLDGSRWYFPVFEGLFDAKHVEQMGQAIWLYGWILARAWIRRQEGVVDYSHIEAAKDLGVTSRTIKAWFSALQEYSYLTTRTRHSHHLTVQVTNWRRIEDWLNDRQAARSEESFTSDDVKCNLTSCEVKKNVMSSEESFIFSITIRILKEYYYKSPDGRVENLADVFHALNAYLRDAPAKSRPAILQGIYRMCFSGDPPAYGYLGKVANSIGGAGRLAERLWELTAKPPTGDVLAYILAEHKRHMADRGIGRQAILQHGQLTAEQREMNDIALGCRKEEDGESG